MMKDMVSQFLSWRLPGDFKPDGGIMFEPVYQQLDGGFALHTPTGTNLFNYTQTLAMLEHVLGDIPAKMKALESEVARLKSYGAPEFYVNATSAATRAAERAKAETEEWKKIAQAANKKSITDESTIRGLRAKLAKLEEADKK